MSAVRAFIDILAGWGKCTTSVSYSELVFSYTSVSFTLTSRLTVCPSVRPRFLISPVNAFFIALSSTANCESLHIGHSSSRLLPSCLAAHLSSQLSANVSRSMFSTNAKQACLVLTSVMVTFTARIFAFVHDCAWASRAQPSLRTRTHSSLRTMHVHWSPRHSAGVPCSGRSWRKISVLSHELSLARKQTINPTPIINAGGCMHACIHVIELLLVVSSRALETGINLFSLVRLPQELKMAAPTSLTQ